MPEYPTVTLKSFSGGQRDRDHPSELLENQYSYGRNIEIRSGGLFDNRRGRTKKVNSPGANPQGACWFSPSPSSFFVIEVNGGRIFKWEGSAATFTEIDPSVQLANTSSPVSFGILNGVLFIFSGNADNVRSWDGSAATLTDEANTNTDPPLTSVVGTQASKLLAGKTDTAGTDDFIYVSSVNDGKTWDRTNNNRRLPSKGNEGLTAIAMYRNGTILAFTRKTAHEIDVSPSAVSDWTRNTLDTEIGSISPWVTVVGDDAFFMSADGHIRSIKRTQFDKAFGVSQPITYWNPNLVERIKKTKLSNTRGAWFDNYLLVGACLDNSNYNNGVIVFDMLHQIQSPSGLIPVCVGEWDNMRPGEWIVTNFNSREQLYYMDALDGALYQMFSGEDDDGETIDSEVHMRSLDFGTQRHDKTVLDGELQVLDTYGDVTISYAKDDGAFSELQEEAVGSSGASLPFTLPVTLGSGGVLDFIPLSFYGLGQSRFWQPKIEHTNGLLSLKQITLRAKVHNALTRGY